MDLELEATLGLYTTHFFKMHVETPSSLEDLSSLDPRAAGTFAHEYLHFLQDISTPFGLMNLSIVVNYIKFCCWQINLNQGKEFQVPIIPSSKDHFNLSKNLDLRRIYLGDSASINRKIDNYELVNSDVFHPQDLINPIKKVVITIGTDQLVFGGGCIMESMAHIAEEFVSSDQISAPIFPYKSAEYLVGQMHPELNNNRLNVFALCDCSLFTDNPGYNFYVALNKMKEDSFIPTDPKDVYNYCNNILESSNSLFTNYDQVFTTAKDQLSDYFTSEDWWAVKDWINHILDEIFKIRKSNISFMLDLMGGNFINNRPFISIINKLGFPVTTNMNQEMFYGPPTDLKIKIEHMDLFWAINQCYRIFIGKRDGCKMKAFCKGSCDYHSIEDYTDERCNTQPWTRSSDSVICIFAHVWKTWGLEGKNPVWQ